MAYSKTTWRDNNTPAIDQSNLGKIETGIFALHALEGNTASAVTSNGNRITAVDNSLNASKSNSESAVTISGRATVTANTANQTSQDANLVSALSNNTSNAANNIIETERMYEFPDELRTLCETRLCKKVDLYADEEGWKCAEYSGGILALDHTGDEVIIEEDEPVGPILGPGGENPN